MTNIYTAGYNAWSFYEFKAKTEELGKILVVDVRYSPKSFNPFWSKKNLKKYFGEHYIHIKNLGNVNYRNGKPIKIYNLDKGCKQLLNSLGKDYDDCLLLCACEDVEECHRKVIVKKLQLMTLCEVIHLKGEEE
jgi:uncharacterized protein (DUF488 family)